MKVLDALRKKFPELTWRAERRGMGWAWIASDGTVVDKRSRLTPRWDGDDDTFTVDFYIRRPGWGMSRSFDPYPEPIALYDGEAADATDM